MLTSVERTGSERLYADIAPRRQGMTYTEPLVHCISPFGITRGTRYVAEEGPIMSEPSTGVVPDRRNTGRGPRPNQSDAARSLGPRGRAGRD